MTQRHNRLADWHVLMISVGGIIGAGLFVGTSATIAAAGPSVLLSYLAAGLLVWFVMMVLGALSRHYGAQGSFIADITRSLGRRSGFITGWSYILLWVVTGGAQAVAGGMILNDLFALPPLLGSFLLMMAALLLNALPVAVYGKSESLLSLLKLLTLIFFIGAGVLWLCLKPGAAAQASHNLLGHGGVLPLGAWAALGVIPMIMQTFTGCEIAFVASAESHDPEKNVRRAVTSLPFLVLFFYLGSVLVILLVRPWTEIIPGHSPFLVVMHYLNIPFAEMIVVVMTLLAVMSCLNSANYLVSRIARELAELGCAPPQLGKKTSNGVPLVAVVLTTCLEVMIVLLASWSPSKGYSLLLGASGNLILFCYFMASLSCLSLRKTLSQPVMTVLSVLSVLVMGGLFVIIPFEPATWGEGLMAACILLGLGLVSLIAVQKSGKRM